MLSKPKARSHSAINPYRSVRGLIAGGGTIDIESNINDSQLSGDFYFNNYFKLVTFVY